MSERARSFDRVAADYERYRPGYPDEAVRWLAERLGIGPGRRVLDLAAGTGKLTRSLVALGADVVAVEPGAPMLAELRRVLPHVESHAGAAEAIPLPDASVDAVTIAQAFHWFRLEDALPELHRVLRPGGGFGTVWNWWDERDPLQARIVEHAPGEPTDEDDPVPGELFGEREEREFWYETEMTPDLLVARLETSSRLITATPDERAAILGEIRALAEERGERFALLQRTFAHVYYRRG